MYCISRISPLVERLGFILTGPATGGLRGGVKVDCAKVADVGDAIIPGFDEAGAGITELHPDKTIKSPIKRLLIKVTTTF